MTSTSTHRGRRTSAPPSEETADRSAGASTTSSARLPTLSGVAFAVLLLVGFFLSGANTPDATAADQEWTTWADGNDVRSRTGAFLTLVAGAFFLHFAGTIRTVLEAAEATVSGSAHLARTAFAGAVTGITGITLAIVTMAGASAEGADADPLVIRTIASTAVGPFLVAAMGFAALLAAAAVVMLRSGVIARWIGIVAALGAAAFLVTFCTLLAGPGRDSSFGYGFFLGFLALATWSIATSIARYRSAATTTREPSATSAG
jgi:succinate dehydrogenase/fumarate reductase cytochrome b subunit